MLKTIEFVHCLRDQNNFYEVTPHRFKKQVRIYLDLMTVLDPLNCINYLIHLRINNYIKISKKKKFQDILAILYCPTFIIYISRII